MSDGCGAISLSNSATGDLTFGTSGGTDCTTPGVGGAGNTHASRTGFYHLTDINRKAATFLPGNAWLNGTLTANMNINNHLQRVLERQHRELLPRRAAAARTPASSRRSSSTSGATGWTRTRAARPSDQGSGEAVGDTFAFLETRDGCIGQNFLPGENCDNCTACTGVRDVSDFDVSGPAVIARPSNVTNNAGINCDRFACPYLSQGISLPGPDGLRRPLRELIAGSANWDLAQTLIAALGTEPGWAKMDQIWYGSLTPSKSAYRVASGGTCNPSATVDGCAATNWYTVYLTVDDDDGNLANGTPNACRIWDAFDAHGIACGQRPACSTGGSCGTPACPLSSCAPPLPPASSCPIDTLVFTSKTGLGWLAPTACALPLEYDTAKGNLDCLRSTCRPIGQSVPVCLPLEDDSGDLTAVDAAAPDPGDGFWYLARVHGGTWNSTSEEQCTDYDAALPLGCP